MVEALAASEVEEEFVHAGGVHHRAGAFENPAHLQGVPAIGSVAGWEVDRMGGEPEGVPDGHSGVYSERTHLLAGRGDHPRTVHR